MRKRKRLHGRVEMAAAVVEVATAVATAVAEMEVARVVAAMETMVVAAVVTALVKALVTAGETAACLDGGGSSGGHSTACRGLTCRTRQSPTGLPRLWKAGKAP